MAQPLTSARTAPAATEALPGRLGAGEAARLQLLPGFASLAAYLLLAPMAASVGLPAFVPLMLAILLAEAPVSWAIMLRRVRRETGGRFSLAAAFPWRERVPWWQYLVIGVPVLLLSAMAMGGAAPLMERALRPTLFAWVPDWFVLRSDPSMFADLAPGTRLGIGVISLLGLVLVGGPTQELYSRGFLLPRTRHWGRGAPVFNAGLFAVFHLIAPWAWPAFFLGVLPWAFLVWWKRSIQIGLFAHVGMLALQWAGMTLLLMGYVPVAPGQTP